MNGDFEIHCPMRHENGNCLPNGGFCTSVNKEICFAMQKAYQTGKNDALRMVANRTVALNSAEIKR